MLYNMLYNPFRTSARVAVPPAHPPLPLVDLFMLSWIHSSPDKAMALPSSSETPIPSRTTPHPRSRPGAAALSRSGAAAWRATPAPPLSWRAAPALKPPLGGRHRSSCLLSSCKGLGPLHRSSCLLSSCKGLGGCKGLGHVRDLGKRRT